MSHHSGSSQFRRLFDDALHDYEKTTNIALAKHPLAEQLQNSHTVEPIILLQDRARELGDFPGSDRMMKSIKNTVSVLGMLLDTTTALGEAIDPDLVRFRVVMGHPNSDGYSTVILACESSTNCHCHPTCRV